MKDCYSHTAVLVCAKHPKDVCSLAVFVLRFFWFDQLSSVPDLHGLAKSLCKASLDVDDLFLFRFRYRLSIELMTQNRKYTTSGYHHDLYVFVRLQ